MEWCAPGVVLSVHHLIATLFQQQRHAGRMSNSVVQTQHPIIVSTRGWCAVKQRFQHVHVPVARGNVHRDRAARVRGCGINARLQKRSHTVQVAIVSSTV